MADGFDMVAGRAADERAVVALPVRPRLGAGRRTPAREAHMIGH